MKALLIGIVLLVLISEILVEAGLYVYYGHYRWGGGRYIYKVYLFTIGIILPRIRESKNIYLFAGRVSRGEDPIPFGKM